MRLPRIKALLASAAILASLHVAEAQFATEFTQLLNNAQLVQHGAEQLKQSAQFAQQITNQVQQIQNQLQMYQNMLQKTATLPTRIWGQAQARLGSVGELDPARSVTRLRQVEHRPGVSPAVRNLRLFRRPLRRRCAPHHQALDPFRRKEGFGRHDPWANGLPGGESQRGP